MNDVYSRFFSNKAKEASSVQRPQFGAYSSQADGSNGLSVWPKPQIITFLEARFGTVEPLGIEGDASIYGVIDGGLRFAVILMAARGAEESIAEMGFVARFEGYGISDATLESLNRNLHISFIALEGANDAYLVGGATPSGPFSDAACGLILDAWRRDLAMTLVAIGEHDTPATAFPGASIERVQSFVANSAQGPSFSRNTAASLLGARASSLRQCPACDGRGKVGIAGARCEVCGGTGLTFSPA